MTARPRLRGLLHQYAFFASLFALPVLILVSPTGRAVFAGTVYGLSLVALFGVSALFHRVTWSERARRWMGRLDHAMINVATPDRSRHSGCSHSPARSRPSAWSLSGAARSAASYFTCSGSMLRSG